MSARSITMTSTTLPALLSVGFFKSSHATTDMENLSIYNLNLESIRDLPGAQCESVGTPRTPSSPLFRSGSIYGDAGEALSPMDWEDYKQRSWYRKPISMRPHDGDFNESPLSSQYASGSSSSNKSSRSSTSNGCLPSPSSTCGLDSVRSLSSRSQDTRSSRSSTPRSERGNVEGQTPLQTKKDELKRLQEELRRGRGNWTEKVTRSAEEYIKALEEFILREQAVLDKMRKQQKLQDKIDRKQLFLHAKKQDLRRMTIRTNEDKLRYLIELKFEAGEFESWFQDLQALNDTDPAQFRKKYGQDWSGFKKLAAEVRKQMS